MKKKVKTALITSGGGMACSYTTGVLKALIKDYNFTSPDFVIGGSGSVGVVSYFVAKQYDLMEKVWYFLASDMRFVNPLRFWKVMDIDYLIHEVLGKKYKIDVEKIIKSDTKLFVAATNCLNGKVKYFNDFNKYDLLQVIKASKAIPIAYNRRIKIKGKYYCDSLISSSVDHKIKKALKLGAKRVIVVKNDNPSFFSSMGYKIWLKLQKDRMKDNQEENQNLDFRKFNLPKGFRSVILKPSIRHTTTPIINNKEDIRKTIELGYNDTISNLKLKKFFNRDQSFKPIYNSCVVMSHKTNAEISKV